MVLGFNALCLDQQEVGELLLLFVRGADPTLADCFPCWKRSDSSIDEVLVGVWKEGQTFKRSILST